MRLFTATNRRGATRSAHLYPRSFPRLASLNALALTTHLDLCFVPPVEPPEEVTVVVCGPGLQVMPAGTSAADLEPRPYLFSQGIPRRITSKGQGIEPDTTCHGPVRYYELVTWTFAINRKSIVV